MNAPLKINWLALIYALSGSPHPDTPQVPAGKAAAIEAENARLSPRSGPAPPASPQPAALPFQAEFGRKQQEFFPLPDVTVEVTPERARFRPKIREEIE